MNAPSQRPEGGWRERLHRVVFESDTPGGRVFDVALLWAILLSVFVVAIESVESVRVRWGLLLLACEWGFTVLFTVEYGLRLVSVRRPLRYATSFFGVVDLLAILPTYLSLLIPGAQSLMVVRSLRLLRIFRVLKLGRHVTESGIIVAALRASREKIAVFLLAVLTIVTIVGSLMYLIEGPENGFTDIPTGVYWAVVTLTTVGFGDIVPQTGLGRVVTSALVLLGYSVIAVPTGIVTAELTDTARRRHRAEVSGQACPSCGRGGHDPDATCCKHCGARLEAT